MQKYYSKLMLLENDQEEGLFCKGRGWSVVFESNPSSAIIVNSGKPSQEIVILAKSLERAQYVSNMILASYYLYTGEALTFDMKPVFPNRPQTITEIAEQKMSGDSGYLGVFNLPISCLISAKASQRIKYQYAIFKYYLGFRTVPLRILSLDPSGDWFPGKAVTESPEEHVLNAYSIVLCYSVLEELSLEIRASKKSPSMINGSWNPEVKRGLQERLDNSGIDLSEPILWNLRDTPTSIERTRRPTIIRKTEWSGLKVRDAYIELIEAIAYASWLRSSISSHRLSKLAKSLTIYDVANVQHLSRRLLLEILGFWRNYSN